MPADAGSGGIFGDKHLLEASWRVACEGFGARANSYQKLRQIVGLCEPAAVEIVTPAIGNGAAPAGEAVEFELPKRKALDFPQQDPLFLDAEKVRLVLHAFRKSDVAEKIKRRVTGAHSIFSVQALWQVCGRHGRPARPWPRSLPSGGDPETRSG